MLIQIDETIKNSHNLSIPSSWFTVIFFMILSSKIKNHSFFGVYLLRGERSEVLNLGWEVRQVRQWIIQGIRNGC